MALRTGTYGIGTTTGEDRLVRLVDEQGLLLEPGAAPLLTMFASLEGKIKGIQQTKYEHFEDDYQNEWVQNSTTVSSTTGSTTLLAVDATQWVPGELYTVFQDPTVGSSHENFRVTAVDTGTNVITVVRAVQGTTILAIPAGGYILRSGAAYSEGAGMPTGRSTIPVGYTSGPQVFRRACQPISMIAATTKNYANEGKGERNFQHAKVMVEIKKLINRAFFFGKYQYDTTGDADGAILYTEGIKSRISTNVFNMGGTMSERGFAAVMEQAFVYGSPEKTMVCAPIYASAIDAWAGDKLIIEQGETTYGLKIMTWISPHGTLKILVDKSLTGNGRYGVTGAGHMAFILDMDELYPFYLNGNGISHNIQVWLDRIKDGKTVYRDEVYCAYGLKLKHEKKHSFLYNGTDYSST